MSDSRKLNAIPAKLEPKEMLLGFRSYLAESGVSSTGGPVAAFATTAPSFAGSILGVAMYGDQDYSMATPDITFAMAGSIAASPNMTMGFGTTWNSVSNQQSESFWSVVALSFSRLAIRGETSWYVPSASEKQQDISIAGWATLLTNLILEYTPNKAEQHDIVEVIENSLSLRAPEYFVSPTSLLRVCAIGAVISGVVAEKPHLYSAPGGRVVLDYALDTGRFATIVTDDYVHILGDLHGEFRELTLSTAKYDLLEVEKWIEKD